MKYDILLAGVGGQGVLSLAAIIAQAAVNDGLFVKQSEIHGMAQRGGGVSAHLRISDQPIASDLIASGEADLILSMEPLEALRYRSFLHPERGVVVTAREPVVNIPDYPALESVLKMLEVYPRHTVVPAAELARQVGNAKAVNMVLVGSAAANLPIGLPALKKAIADLFGAKGEALVCLNLEAFRLGQAGQ